MQATGRSLNPKFLVSVAVIAGACLGGAGLGASDSGVPYPQGYRAWQHVKSMVIEPGHPLHASFGGMHPAKLSRCRARSTKLPPTSARASRCVIPSRARFSAIARCGRPVL